jgi:predicted Zn-dependent peptidase
VDLRGPVAQLAVVFRAGARYESLPDEQGITHHIRNAVGLDSKSYLGVQLLWEFGTAGVNLVASTSRDLFTVHVSVLRDQA